ncbi:hypothetical protein [Paraglaciecola arctica]|uniref:hypothetical protein n=1 Tax=Paraglaciecola arctica TaxID=1128911 RepID=UPI001C079B54|nr:hypothetical protein [Paraglaciecola arctica]MBU3005379.1 hypothetical protein [Paraglaciecola arctica]
MNPEQIFNKHQDSLMNLLRAADVYALLKIDDLRGTDEEIKTAKEVIAKSGSSHLIHSKHFFLSKDEQNLFEKDEYVSGVCQHVVQSCYTAIENYLTNFFIIQLKLKLNDETMSEAILKNISFRSLDWIKKHYKTFLGINLASFNHNDISTYEESWFHPRDEWNGLTILSQVRNEIAHEGYCKSYSIHYPVDAYAVIHFIKRWVMFFDIKYGESRT